MKISFSICIDSCRQFLNNRSMRLLVLTLVVLLSACVAVPLRPPVANPPAVWQARQASLRYVQVWELRGRLAIRTADEGFQASLRWVRDAERHRLELAGPLGGGRVRLTQDKRGAELRDAKDKVYRDSSAQNLLMRATGWNVPLEGLNYWVLGLPAPGAVTRSEIDEWGRLKALEQDGWEISFVEYADSGAFELPSRVFVKRSADSAAGAPLEVRLVIEKWAFPDRGQSLAPK